MPEETTPFIKLREHICSARFGSQLDILKELINQADLDVSSRQAISREAITLVEDIRKSRSSGLLEEFFKEYGLSSQEGLALMSLAEALMRIPDASTKDLLIEDKIATSKWGSHFGHSGSSVINISTLGLMAAGSILEKSSSSIAGSLHEVVKRLGEPVIRVAVGEAMKLLGERFVLGQSIDQAMRKSHSQMSKGCTYSYDMLGEAARTKSDADKYFQAYESSIDAVAAYAHDDDIHNNPGISIKLSALHPRYEFSQKGYVVRILVDRLVSLAKQAKEHNIGLTIDAEEADRLDLSLDIIEQVISSSFFSGWDGFGVVVQAYSPCAPFVIDWLYALAKHNDRRITVRLVKGAYWDTEIKRAQVMGLESFPVYTRKTATDVSYICCAKKLLQMTDHIYPQFATHNAYTVSAILHMTRAVKTGGDVFEFQRLHGMGETLHSNIMKAYGGKCRIYAPVGIHEDLLAYLVRRLLENGANSSFINQIVDEAIPPAEIASDPFEALNIDYSTPDNRNIKQPSELYLPDRANSRGWDLSHDDHLYEIQNAIAPFKKHQWTAGPLINGQMETGRLREVSNPAVHGEVVGTITSASEDDIELAFNSAEVARKDWTSLRVSERAEYLRVAADLYEKNFGELFALLIREAGKTYLDCIAELREAVDFLRYYASESERGNCIGKERGIITCISPWNFPLAIFTGQIAAALAAGNVVLAKPADVTPLIAYKAVSLLHEAGIPKGVLQLLPGSGRVVGSRITSDKRVAGVCFTGSLETARTINQSMAEGAQANAMLIAETGGLNAMIVDSTSLPEQVVIDILTSAFQSAGQRCSALRMLYVQEDIAERFIEMLTGAMDNLRLGNPMDISTDIGPVIDEASRSKILEYIQKYAERGRVLKRIAALSGGSYVAPTILKVSGIEDLEEEIFGPVLHVATYKAENLDQVIQSINSRGYGLTFGLHSRIGERIYYVASKIKAGNIYVNRNQIGAVVGTQPFGGEGLSGTGPKAGGPRYLQRFLAMSHHGEQSIPSGVNIGLPIVQEALEDLKEVSVLPIEVSHLPGPTGEENTLSTYSRGKILCLGPGAEALEMQITMALDLGCSVLALTPDGYLHKETQSVAAGKLAVLEGVIPAEKVKALRGLAAVSYWGKDSYKRELRKALAEREGEIIPLITEDCGEELYIVERHLCINTAAAGGDTSLFSIDDI